MILGCGNLDLRWREFRGVKRQLAQAFEVSAYEHCTRLSSSFSISLADDFWKGLRSPWKMQRRACRKGLHRRIQGWEAAEQPMASGYLLKSLLFLRRAVGQRRSETAELWKSEVGYSTSEPLFERRLFGPPLPPAETSAWCALGEEFRAAIGRSVEPLSGHPSPASPDRE